MTKSNNLTAPNRTPTATPKPTLTTVPKTNPANERIKREYFR